MGWLIDNIVNGIWAFFADLATSVIDLAYQAIVDFVINLNDIDKFINTSTYLKYSQAIAASLLLVAIAWRCLKSQSGLDNGNRSFGVIAAKTTAAGVGIFLLPFFLKNVLLPLNNNLVQLIQDLNEGFTQDKFMHGLGLEGNLLDLGGTMILIFLVLGIAFIVLSISGAFRYIEVVISIIIAPIVAVSIINDGDGVQVWFKETIAIVFTQSVHILLLQLLLEVMQSNSGLYMCLISIACVGVMIKGPKVLRSYLYSSGVGSATVNMSSAAARLFLMKTMMKSSSPIPKEA